jgi:hypothetical protein
VLNQRGNQICGDIVVTLVVSLVCGLGPRPGDECLAQVVSLAANHRAKCSVRVDSSRFISQFSLDIPADIIPSLLNTCICPEVYDKP